MLTGNTTAGDRILKKNLKTRVHYDKMMSHNQWNLFYVAIRDGVSPKALSSDQYLQNNDAVYEVLYKLYKSQQPKNSLIKWPASDKDQFFILPRSFVNRMPNKWKTIFQKLLMSFYKKNGFPDWYGVKLKVAAKKNGKYAEMPEEFKIN